MQPGTLVLLITVLPFLTTNAVYLLSAYEEFVPWCIPYIDGCTTISQAARSGNSIFIYRTPMVAYAVLLIWFWIYAQHWLTLLYGYRTNVAHIILWLGIVGAIFLIVYIDFLGTTGEVNRFMRRYGIMMFFTLTPLAQLLMLNQHYKILPSIPEGATKPVTIKPWVLRYQLIVLLLMLIIGIISIILDITQIKTYESENIVEWNFSLLLNMYFLGMIFIWKDYRYYLKNN
jgi:hypothetical protein